MKLNTLISHSAQLLKILYKSFVPPDKIASQFFREKKYIGSNERKFISEIVFSALRNKQLLDYCVKMISQFLTDNSLFLKNDSNNENTLEKYHVFSICIIFETISINNLQNNPNDIVISFLKFKKEDFLIHLADSFSESFSVSNDIANYFIKSISNIFLDLNIKIELLSNSINSLNSNYTFNNDSLELLQNRFSILSWILKLFVIDNAHFNTNEFILFLNSLLSPAPLSIRFNPNLVSQDEIISFLSVNNTEAHKGSLSPHSIILNKRVNLNDFSIYKNGLIEIQDEGSQIISFVASPNEDDIILDACAGAGGKSLHLALLQNDNGQIYSTDIDFKKLKELETRAKRLKLNSISTIHLNDKSLKQISNNKNHIFNKKFDLVLVDAPCSGMGTIRRNPNQKWRLSENLLNRLTKNQKDILQFNSQFVKLGGILVYATCSFLPQENDETVDWFLNENQNFVPDPIKPILDIFNIEIPYLDNSSHKLLIKTSEFGCDTFFVSRLKRIE